MLAVLARLNRVYTYSIQHKLSHRLCLRLRTTVPRCISVSVPLCFSSRSRLVSNALYFLLVDSSGRDGDEGGGGPPAETFLPKPLVVP